MRTFEILLWLMHIFDTWFPKLGIRRLFHCLKLVYFEFEFISTEVFRMEAKNCTFHPTARYTALTIGAPPAGASLLSCPLPCLPLPPAPAAPTFHAYPVEGIINSDEAVVQSCLHSSPTSSARR